MHNCTGRDNLKARQGYYIRAANEVEAMEKMAEDFPDDRHGFTADRFKE